MSINKKQFAGLLVIFLSTFWFFGGFLFNNSNLSKGFSKEFDFKDSIKEPVGYESFHSESNSLFLETAEEGMYNINVDIVRMEEPGFVVVVDENDSVIGASRFLPKGISSTFSILLTQPLVSGKTYSTVLFSDNGNKKFYPKEDFIYLDPRNNLASISSFSVR